MSAVLNASFGISHAKILYLDRMNNAVIIGLVLLTVALVVVLVIALTPRSTLIRFYPAYDYVFPRWVGEGPFPISSVPPGPIIPGSVHPPDPNPLPYPPLSKKLPSFNPHNVVPHSVIPPSRIEAGSGATTKAGSESLIPGASTEMFASA